MERSGEPSPITSVQSENVHGSRGTGIAMFDFDVTDSLFWCRQGISEWVADRYAVTSAAEIEMFQKRAWDEPGVLDGLVSK